MELLRIRKRQISPVKTELVAIKKNLNFIRQLQCFAPYN